MLNKTIRSVLKPVRDIMKKYVIILIMIITTATAIWGIRDNHSLASYGFILIMCGLSSIILGLFLLNGEAQVRSNDVIISGGEEDSQNSIDEPENDAFTEMKSSNGFPLFLAGLSSVALGILIKLI